MKHDQTLIELARLYGTTSNSYLSLYPDYQTFALPGREGVIRYLNCRFAWVGAAEPLCPPTQTVVLLRAFAEEARAQGKVAILLPVADTVREHAEEVGYRSMAIGLEPIVDFDRYDFSQVHMDSVRRLKAHGAQVREFRPESLAPDQKRQVDSLIAEWLDSRKTAELGFLNQVKPWELAQEKKYFALYQERTIACFVAAVPALASSGWYLVDCFRGQRTPTGATELLYLEAMQQLKQQGAKWASQGVSPLADCKGILKLVFEHGDWFYNFRSLYQYKLKFKPTRFDRTYVIVSPKIGPRAALGLGEAFGTRSKHPIFENVKHFLKHLFREIFHAPSLDNDLVWRNPPIGFLGALKRVRLSLLFSAIVLIPLCSLPGALGEPNDFYALTIFVPLYFAYERLMGSLALTTNLFESIFFSALVSGFYYSFHELTFSHFFAVFLMGTSMCLAGAFARAVNRGAQWKLWVAGSLGLGWMLSPIASGICVMNFLLGYVIQDHRFRPLAFLVDSSERHLQREGNPK